MKIAIFASGNGTNFEAIINSKFNTLKIALLVCNKSDAFVIERAKKHNIPTFVFSYQDYKNTKEAEEVILIELRRAQIQAIVLAGYMRILTTVLLKPFANMIINIHPALLPAFKGAHGIKDAYEYGVKVMGVTVHYVTEELDGGAIIDQESFYVGKKTFSEAEQAIHEIEYRLYPKVIKELFDEE